MHNFQRIYQLHHILAARNQPVSHKNIEQLLEYDREHNDYYYDAKESGVFELPGIWFDAHELYALLTAQQLLEQIQPGLLGAQLRPIKSQLEKIPASRNLNNQEITDLVRILSMMCRNKTIRHFQQVASTLLQRQQLDITYHSRSHDQQTERTVSPQRLTHYRDNWYLDAWCHKRNALRSFAVERIVSSVLLDHAALEIPETELNEHFATSYGIFAGKENQTAVLHFTAERARWVADEQWHPQQQGKFLPDDRYELCIPYANETELVMDILRHGVAIGVIAPETLRHTIMENLREAQEKYLPQKNGK